MYYPNICSIHKYVTYVMYVSKYMQYMYYRVPENICNTKIKLISGFSGIQLGFQVPELNFDVKKANFCVRLPTLTRSPNPTQQTLYKVMLYNAKNKFIPNYNIQKYQGELSTLSDNERILGSEGVFNTYHIMVMEAQKRN